MRRLLLEFVAPLAALASSTGCFGEFGDYEPPTGQGGSDVDVVRDGGGSPSGGAPAALVEDCSNGVDDNDDDLVDCADNRGCSGYQCLSTAGFEDWEGPFQRLSPDENGDFRPCAPSFPSRLETSLRVVGAPCTCTCGDDAAGGTCTAAVDFFDNADCGGLLGTANASTSCAPLAAGLSGASSAAAHSVVTGGSCSRSIESGPSDGDPEIALCKGTFGAGCELAGDAGGCARPGSKSEPLCMMHAGEVACPASAVFSSRQVVYDADATRPTCDLAACGTCSATNGVCAGAVDLLSACAGAVVDTLALDAGCVNVSPSTAVALSPGAILDQGACSPSAPTPIGALSGGTTATLCCMK
ncbi:MAG: hypothetical protein U0271_07675 [Polyangiaceae bacterium]